MSNKYGSLLDTFTGMDVYNLALPVTPPNDLSLPANRLSPRYLAGREGAAGPVIGFDPKDRPFLKSIGIFSNMADGLVDANSNNLGYSNGHAVTFGLDRFFPRLSGTISNNPAGGTPTIVTGSGTLFSRQTCPGMTLVWLDDDDNVHVNSVASVESDTSLTLSVAPPTAGMYSGHQTTAKRLWGLIQAFPGGSITARIPSLNQLYPYSFFIGDVSNIRPVEGRLTFKAGSSAVTGKNTRFLRDVAPGQCLRYAGDNGVIRTVRVASVASDVSLTLSVPGTGSAGVPVTGTGVEVGDMDSFLGIRATLVGGFYAYTKSIDPSYDGARLGIHVVAEIEHTHGVSQVLDADGG